MTAPKPLRVLLLTREDHPSFRAGILCQYGYSLPRLGVRTTLAAMAARPDQGSADAPWSGGELVLWPRPGGGRARRHLAGLARAVATVWRRTRDHDVVVMRDLIGAGVLALALCRLRGVPFVYWYSFPYPEDDLQRFRAQKDTLGAARRWYTWLRGHATRLLLHRVLLPLSDHCVVISEAMRDEYAARGYRPERMTPNPMGVDADLLRGAAPAPVDDQRLAGKKVLACLGALDKTRRIDFVFEVLALVRRREPEAVLLLIGDAQETGDRRWLEDRAREIGVADAVVWTGWLDRTEAWSYAARADVGLSAVPEGMIFRTMSPTKAVEFMALGVPVVVAGNPDQGGLVAAGGGGRDVPYEPRAFADAVLELLADPQAAGAMGRAGREHVLAHRTYDAISRDMADLFRDLRQRRAGRAR